MGCFLEKERELHVLYDGYDVVVCGGGIAGIAAALAAARNGKHVLLIESMYMLGGLATAGLITIYLPLCDGKGHQVVYGIADELLRLSISEGWERDYPSTWLEGKDEHGNERFEVRFNASVFAILAESILKEAGADILYGTRICSSIMDGERLEAIIVENTDGRTAIPAECFVDATGDASIFSASGAGTVSYAPGNMPAAWFYETINGRNTLHMYGAADTIGMDDEADVPDEMRARRISGLDSREVSAALVNSRALLLKKFLERGRVSEEHSLASIAAMPQLRMIRRICGALTLDENDREVFPDSVGMTGDWRKRGPVFEIPYRSLYSPRISNLIACGRCISVTDAMWDVTRVIPPSALTGEAAGTAASFGGDLRHIDIAKLQSRLRAGGVRLHISEIFS